MPVMRFTIAILVALAGCGSKDEAPASPDQWATAPRATPSPSSRPAPPTARPTSKPWTLTLSSSYGPCSEDDLRSCHRTWYATSDGKITQTDASNSTKRKDVTTTRHLTPADRDALDALVSSAEFVAGMAHGFPCQGGGHDPDATLQLAFAQSQQYVEGCTRGGPDGGGDPNGLVNRITHLLGR